MKHFSQSETECEAVLDVFFKVIKSTNSSVIQEFSTQIQVYYLYIYNEYIKYHKHTKNRIKMQKKTEKNRKFYPQPPPPQQPPPIGGGATPDDVGSPPMFLPPPPPPPPFRL